MNEEKKGRKRRKTSLSASNIFLTQQAGRSKA